MWLGKSVERVGEFFCINMCISSSHLQAARCRSARTAELKKEEANMSSSLKNEVAGVTNATYVILGATGNTGSIVANSLLSKGNKGRVVGRDAERLPSLVRKGGGAG